MSQLTAKQTRFCQEYVVDFNATQAYARAGYSETGAAQSASALLRNPKIQEELATLQAEDATRLELTHQVVLEGLWGIAADLDATVSARVRAYELLGKHQGMFTDRLEITQITRGQLDAEIERLEAELADNG